MGGNDPVVDAFAGQPAGHRLPLPRRLVDGPCPNPTEIRRDFIRQHLFQAYTEQMRRIAALRPREHAAPKPCRARRATMAPGAAVGKSGSERGELLDIAYA